MESTPLLLGVVFNPAGEHEQEVANHLAVLKPSSRLEVYVLVGVTGLKNDNGYSDIAFMACGESKDRWWTVIK